MDQFPWSSQLFVLQEAFTCLTARKEEYLATEAFLFWMYARYRLDVTLFQICQILVILLLLSGRT